MATDYSVLCSICSCKVPTIYAAVFLAIGEVFISLENMRHAPGIAYPMDSLWEENPELKLFFIILDLVNTVFFLLALCFRSSWLVLVVFVIYGCDAAYQFFWFVIYAVVGLFPGTFGRLYWGDEVFARLQLFTNGLDYHRKILIQLALMNFISVILLILLMLVYYRIQLYFKTQRLNPTDQLEEVVEIQNVNYDHDDRADTQ